MQYNIPVHIIICKRTVWKIQAVFDQYCGGMRRLALLIFSINFFIQTCKILPDMIYYYPPGDKTGKKNVKRGNDDEQRKCAEVLRTFDE
jgi:hypothetical protein